MESKDTYGDCISVVQQILCSSYNDEALFQAFQILQKILQNIVTNPNEAKFKSVKTSNATLQKKLFSIREVAKLLETLGFVHVDDALVFTGSDLQTIGRVAGVVEGQAQKIKERNMTQAEKDDLAKQKYLEERRKELEAENKRIEDEKKKLQAMIDADKKETALREAARDARANQLNFGATNKTWEDIGINLKNQPRGGG